jgi:hypothetical protein
MEHHIMRNVLGLLLLALSLFGPLSADAAPMDYTINFALGNASNGIVPTSGSFTFDSANNLFSNFVVEWEGLTFDLTSEANTPSIQGNVSSCLGSATGGDASFLLLSGACGSFSTRWEAALGVVGDASFAFIGNEPGTGGFFQIRDTLILNPTRNALAYGSWDITQGEADVPEPATLSLSLSALAALALVQWRRRAASRADL